MFGFNALLLWTICGRGGSRQTILTYSRLPLAPSMSIDRLFPALLECFGIILCGYFAGRINIITSTQAKGLGNFVSTFALPALLFKNMVVLDFTHVNWNFLLSILVAKVAVFIIVCILTLLVASPENRFSKAGLFPIFATQSNDFALGYPIVEALYIDTYPEYLQYIYLVAPVSLMLLNPIGFIFCEIQKWKENTTHQQSKLKTIGLVLFQVFKNPIVFMVIVGICGNFILKQKIPVFMGEFLDGLSSSFSGSALFYLGLTMVGQIKKLKKNSFVAIILLITAKLLVLPLISREMVELLDNGNTEANYTSLSNYAFLYGVFPTAPSVAIFASQYNMEMEIVTPGMVINTFVSAPIMYMSAWLLTIPSMHAKLLLSALQSVSFDISIVTLFFLIWSLAVMLLSKKFKQMPHLFTVNLLLAQCMVSVGMIMWYFITKQTYRLGQVLVFIVLYSSLYSTYIWTVGTFCLVRIPALIVGILLITGHPNTRNDCDSAFFYGNAQVISTAVVLSCSILIAGLSLMCLSRNRQQNTYQILERNSVSSNVVEEPMLKDQSENVVTVNNEQPGTELVVEKVVFSNYRICLFCLMAEQCRTLCTSENCMLVQEEQLLQNADPQLGRHVLLCLLLIIGLFANVSSCLWWLFNHEPGRLYVELQFFCVIFNFGQGFISFGIFGLDKHLIILPCKKRLEFLWHGRDIAAQNDSAIREEMKMTCQQFVQYHKNQCASDIVKERRCGAQSYTDVFQGCHLVDWLIQVGLAHDRGEAVNYGNRLLKGGVIQHITEDYSFCDESLYYRMMPMVPYDLNRY
uniref:G protein-coupled receptor 155 n=1 Tax=Callorhinchus milii TaxID=7868 RepID=A0A4W3IP52_CALMI